MLERLSVRKPFTVLVGVILILILGFVAFQNTSTDLMPNMNLPYALVMTTGIGSTPEEMESQITQPIESRMATVTGIDNITSISQEHVSMVILEFVDSVNMDAVVLEIREGLDMLTLPEKASKPVILKLNPNMLPVMVAAVDADDMDLDQISAMVEDEIGPALEGVSGVASVNLAGLLENQLHVVLYQERIDEVNEKIQAFVQGEIDKARAEMEQQIDAEIEKQVADYMTNRSAELAAEGMSMVEIQTQIQQELPQVTEQITNQITEGLTGDQAGNPDGEGTPDPSEMGLPQEMLTVEAVSGILQAQNFSMPAGSFTEDDVEYMVRTGDKFESVSEIQDLLLFDMQMEGLEPVRLSDIADVFTTDNSANIYTRVNKNPAVMLSIQKQTEFSTSDVTRSIQAKMDELKEKHSSLHITALMDQGEYIELVVNSVLQNLIIGGLLAVLILLIFLRDFRPTLIVGISIPLSIMLAFTAMYFSGITLNIISMSGLALGVGMLVDNSIVVIENIYRMRNDGVPAGRAAVEGAKQVAGAITASTLTTIAVFTPILFIQGITRQLFTDLGLTIAYSLLASLIIALTVVPASCSGVFRNMREKEHKWFNWWVEKYTVLLRGALRFKWLVLLLAAGLLGFSIWGIVRMGAEFIPAMNSPQMSLSVDMPEGAVFEDSVAIGDALQERLDDIDDIETIGISIGGDTMASVMGVSGMGGNNIGVSVYIILKDSPTLSNEELAEAIYDCTDDLNCVITVEDANSDMSLMMGSGISWNLEGSDLDVLRDTAKEVAEIIRNVPGTTDVSDGLDDASPELRIRVDKDKAMEQGLTVAQVLQSVSQALTKPESSLEMLLDAKEYQVMVSDGDWTEPDRKELEALTLTPAAGGTVKLTDIAEVYEDVGLSSISRTNQKRVLTISGEIQSDYNVELVNQEIQKALDNYDFPEDCQIVESGQSQMIDESFNDLWMMALMAIAFIYLIMVAQFQSLLSPFIVMFTIPLAFTGGFMALMIAGMPLSVVGMVGLILLCGVVVNNGIVLIDYINQLRREGMEKREAILQAGRDRMRPIIMTALTTIVAMSTMSIGVGTGSEMAQPMAITTVGGLIYATLMTLFVAPVLYDLFHPKNKQLKDHNNLDAE